MPKKKTEPLNLRPEFRARRASPADVLRHYVICMLIQRGHHVRDIAAAFGVTRQGILYQINRFGLYPFNIVLENLHKARKRYANDPSLVLVLNQAADAIVSLDTTVRERLKHVDGKKLISGEFIAEKHLHETDIDLHKDTSFLVYGPGEAKKKKKPDEEDDTEEFQTKDDLEFFSNLARQNLGKKGEESTEAEQLAEVTEDLEDVTL